MITPFSRKLFGETLDCVLGRLISPERRRRAVERVQQTLGVSERRACRILAQPRSTQRYLSNRSGNEVVLTEHIIELASQYGRYGYRRITAMLRNQGWRVNHKRVERIWRKEGLKSACKAAETLKAVAE